MALSKLGVRERGFRGSPIRKKLAFAFKRPVTVLDPPFGLSQKMAGNPHPCTVLAYPVWSILEKQNKST